MNALSGQNVLTVIRFAEQSIYVRMRIAANVGHKNGDHFWRNVIKDRVYWATSGRRSTITEWKQLVRESELV